MKTVNQRRLDEVLRVLESIEVIDGVCFGDFDPDNAADVDSIAREHLEPWVRTTPPEAQQALRNAIAYFSMTGDAPFQLMVDRCQELTLPDAASWPQFFHQIGMSLFGGDYRDQFNPSEYEKYEWLG